MTEGTGVAIVIASQRLEVMSGIDFLVRAHELHPLARRAVSIRVGDAESIEALEQAFSLNRVDTYLTKLREPAKEWPARLEDRLGPLERLPRLGRGGSHEAAYRRGDLAWPSGRGAT